MVVIKSFLLMIPVAVIISIFFASGEATSHSNEEEVVEYTAVSFIPESDPMTDMIDNWIEDVESATDGRVEINWIGSTDVLPVNAQVEALESGVIDVLFGHVGLYETRIPATTALALSNLDPWEERENGLYEKMDEEHDEINAKYIGRWLVGGPQIWLNEPIEELNDLEELQIRSAPNYTRLFSELGISPVITDPADVYTSLQTGVVEGLVYGGLLGPRENGWTDSANYVLDHPFWNQNTTILMNEDKWGGITTEDQKAINQATTDFEKEMVNYFDEQNSEERENLKEIGIQFIDLSAEEEEIFLRTAQEVEWNNLENIIPQKVDELRMLTDEVQENEEN
ncbi:TRAP transporter substrate-binding protein DctP [Salicibibacter cibarius]|uniref:TRAP transporter substrate-binding protein DctP n=1 Tax=Salicibibacter cibarius TaxID=2743000 RepID=A0A7T7CA20_9BACI|nr:TRAP transporter substrate-binding protein DctP [Salicibibacter cibarius]QQK74403.1 TRAP transporter substrate-binding protein DctP [Salicibibacter cibarius]